MLSPLLFSLVIIFLAILRFYAWKRRIRQMGHPIKLVLPWYLQRLKANQKEILRGFCYFYAALPAHQQKRFEKKTAYFIKRLEFIPRKMEVVTEEMKVLIAASVVQISFGLKGVHLQYFYRILVYPDTYFSTISQRYHNGEVNPKGRIIVLSWKAFLEGYLNPTNGRNLGLHEMAHALRLENAMLGSKRGFWKVKLLNKFDRQAENFRNKILQGVPTIFRAYGAVNQEEFFAVAAELFFETPRAFKAEAPLLYSIMVELMGQDPIRLMPEK